MNTYLSQNINKYNNRYYISKINRILILNLASLYLKVVYDSIFLFNFKVNLLFNRFYRLYFKFFNSNILLAGKSVSKNKFIFSNYLNLLGNLNKLFLNQKLAEVNEFSSFHNSTLTPTLVSYSGIRIRIKNIFKFFLIILSSHIINMRDCLILNLNYSSNILNLSNFLFIYFSNKLYFLN